MNYHLISTDNMLNGNGLRVVLFLSGCNHKCYNCHNQQTWDKNSGYKFEEKQVDMIVEELKKPYIKGLTLTGGDPLLKDNVEDVFNLICELHKRKALVNKDIWIYTGFTIEKLLSNLNKGRKTFDDIQEKRIDETRVYILSYCDVMVDGLYVDELKDEKYHWGGSTNQRVIDLKKTLKTGNVVLYKQ